MSKNLDITIYDIESTCRTCLSREDLKPLYRECFESTSLVNMLMTCTIVKFEKDDGLPVVICINCINEINKAFLFAKRCETTDAILSRCVKNIKTKLANNVPTSQKVQANEEIEIKPEILTVQEVLDDFEFVAIEEEDVKIKYEEVKPEEELSIEDANFEYPTNESYDKDDDLDQDKTYSEKSADFGFKPNINYQTERESSKDEDPADENYEEHDDEGEDESYSEKSDNLDSNDGDGSEPTKKGNKNLKKITHSVNQEDNNFFCSDCGNGFVTKHLLNSHSKFHANSFPYVCHVCGRTFGRLGNLYRHKLVHTGEKRHVCTFCNKAFALPDSLKTHMRIHTRKKPHSCFICRKEFSRMSQFNVHMRMHKGEKRYYCSICNQDFTRKTTLETHMRIHTGEKPYVCSNCRTTFNRSSTLRDHMRIHTGEKPYSCADCNLRFAARVTLHRHKKSHTVEKFSSSILSSLLRRS